MRVKQRDTFLLVVRSYEQAQRRRAQDENDLSKCQPRLRSYDGLRRIVLQLDVAGFAYLLR